ncbi:MAG TPA: Crp/Fnr family transcriptional regulator [Steroidobacteraceae bacterium]|nr:Crp/Fnr family transcriptional regulator [Steroidobacteraceae bacterium]
MNTQMHAAFLSPNHVSSYPYAIARANALAEPNSTQENDPLRNCLLARLPEAQLARLLPHLERIDMQVGEVICQFGSQSQHVYFPTTAIVSLLYEVKDGLSSEVAIVGNEGMIGGGLFMAGESMPGVAEVRCAGQSFRLRSRIVKEEFNCPGSLQQVLLCYIQALIVEIAQNSVCSRHHTISQQLCLYLLRNLDRSSAREVAQTQEMIAASLGVRRESVTEAALRLRAKDIIDYSRGHIKVLDRDGLESQSCECYVVVKKTFDRLLPRTIELRSATGGATVFRSIQRTLRAAETPKQHRGRLRAMRQASDAMDVVI